ncbi:MAG: site-specific integrase, partial [Pirellulales bacterium]
MRRRKKPPKYACHKASGRARVRIGGRDIYLGEYGSPESWEGYHRVVAEHLAEPAVAPAPVESELLTVVELASAYLNRCESYYGPQSREPELFRISIPELIDLYGRTRADRFGPKSLCAVRHRMIDRGLARTTINARVGHVKRCFKWAVKHELVPPSVRHGLESVDGLRQGYTKAVEPKPVKPVSDDDIESAIPYLSPVVAAMVRFQRWAGARPYLWPQILG